MLKDAVETKNIDTKSAVAEKKLISQTESTSDYTRRKVSSIASMLWTSKSKEDFQYNSISSLILKVVFFLIFEITFVSLLERHLIAY